MEILGSTFDDSVFEESRDKVFVPLPSYNAKFCEPEWFCETITAEDVLERQKCFKFRADLAYSRKQYQKALGDYSSCLALVQDENLTIRRDVMEGQARCYCYLGRRDQALEIIEKLRKEATNTCHLTCILNLELVIHHHFGGTEEEIAALQHLICLHPYNPWHWKRLAEGYLTLLQSTASASSYSKLSHGDGLRGRGGCEGPNGTARDSKLPNGTGDSSEGKGDLCLGQSCSTSVQKHCIDEGAQAQNCDNVWLKACMCFIRARLTLRMLRFQQSSFVLQRSKKALLEVDDALQHLEIQEGTLQLITEVMGKDLVAEKMREDNQDGESLVGLCISDFDDRWYNRVRHALLRSEDTPAE